MEQKYLVNHMAFRVPLFELVVLWHFDEILENCRLATAALLGEEERVVRLAVNLALFLVVLIVLLKHGRTNGTLEMLEVIFLVEGGDVRPTEHTVAFWANQVEPLEVIVFAKDERCAILLGGWEELLDDQLLTVLQMRLGDTRANGLHDNGNIQGDTVYQELAQICQRLAGNKSRKSCPPLHDA